MNLKFIFFFLLSALLAVSCGRRNIPAKPTAERPPVAPANVENNTRITRAVVPINKVEGNDNVDANIRANAAKTAAATEKAIAVIDSKGNVVINAATLPDYVNHNLDSISMVVRSFTPNQAKNLSSRYNFIPPRVIFVPASLQKQGTRGVYFLYKVSNNALWYWKRPDGYFYLDENHYQ